MKLKSFLFALIAVVVMACKSDSTYRPKNLSRLSTEQILEKAEAKTLFNIGEAIYKNEDGVVINLDSLSRLPNMEEWSVDRYVDNDGTIREMILRKATEKDKELQKEIVRLFQKVNLETVNINCDNLGEILTEVHRLDQEMRLAGEIDPEIDYMNLSTIVSLVEKCGMPTLEQITRKQISAIWLVFQHADHETRVKYYPMLKEAADRGDLQKSQMALMQDRILMHDGKPQVYGSQITANPETGAWMLYELENPEEVDKRRATMDLGPLSEYVLNWDIVFDVAQSN